MGVTSKPDRITFLAPLSSYTVANQSLSPFEGVELPIAEKTTITKDIGGKQVKHQIFLRSF